MVRSAAPELMLDDIQPRVRPSSILFRAATAAYRLHLGGTPANDDEPTKRAVQALTRAAVDPMALAGSSLASLAVLDTVVGLAGKSALAGLMAKSMRVSLIGRAGIKIPFRILTAADGGAWVIEGGPIPAAQLNMSAVEVDPYKLAVIVTMTNELGDHSSAQDVITQMLRDASALTLDAKAFSTDALVTGVSPGGLLAGVTPIVGAGATMLATIKALVAALAAAGGGIDPVFICSPTLAVSLKLQAGVRFDYPILTSTALAVGTIIAVEASSFISGFDPVVELRTSDETTIVQNTVGAPIATGAGVLGAPIASLFQISGTAIRMILRGGWGMRAAGHVQVVTDAVW